MRGGAEVAREVLVGEDAEVEGADESGELTALEAGPFVADDTVISPSDVLTSEPLLQPAR